MLDLRYQQALQAATAAGTEAIVRQFELELAGSRAVMCVKVQERLASLDSELRATFYGHAWPR